MVLIVASSWMDPLGGVEARPSLSTPPDFCAKAGPAQTAIATSPMAATLPPLSILPLPLMVYRISLAGFPPPSMDPLARADGAMPPRWTAEPRLRRRLRTLRRGRLRQGGRERKSGASG